ncbi:MAG TPA: DUF2630 family protein [Solirubrobacteraceae bacterium]|nr:DUF2630 family protein [Solirubrobacteraceae bacterium]HSD81823.1 DUF2630 family protein [Solirubrobacteraceae bacterium]
MDDARISDTIERLVAEEHRLLAADPHKVDLDERHRRLDEVKVELDRCWDLLRQRRALREFDEDPDRAEVRDADTVERYLQ